MATEADTWWAGNLCGTYQISPKTAPTEFIGTDDYIESSESNSVTCNWTSAIVSVGDWKHTKYCQYVYVSGSDTPGYSTMHPAWFGPHQDYAWIASNSGSQTQISYVSSSSTSVLKLKIERDQSTSASYYHIYTSNGDYLTYNGSKRPVTLTPKNESDAQLWIISGRTFEHLGCGTYDIICAAAPSMALAPIQAPENGVRLGLNQHLMASKTGWVIGQVPYRYTHKSNHPALYNTIGDVSLTYAVDDASHDLDTDLNYPWLWIHFANNSQDTTLATNQIWDITANNIYNRDIDSTVQASKAIRRVHDTDNPTQEITVSKGYTHVQQLAGLAPESHNIGASWYVTATPLYDPELIPDTDVTISAPWAKISNAGSDSTLSDMRNGDIVYMHDSNVIQRFNYKVNLNNLGDTGETYIVTTAWRTKDGKTGTVSEFAFDSSAGARRLNDDGSASDYVNSALISSDMVYQGSADGFAPNAYVDNGGSLNYYPSADAPFSLTGIDSYVEMHVLLRKIAYKNIETLWTDGTSKRYYTYTMPFAGPISDTVITFKNERTFEAKKFYCTDSGIAIELSSNVETSILAHISIADADSLHTIIDGVYQIVYDTTTKRYIAHIPYTDILFWCDSWGDDANSFLANYSISIYDTDNVTLTGATYISKLPTTSSVTVNGEVKALTVITATDGRHVAASYQSAPYAQREHTISAYRLDSDQVMIMPAYTCRDSDTKSGKTTTNVFTTLSGNAGIVKYSHTPNWTDTGHQTGGYDNNLDLNDVVTIPGARLLYVTVTYGGESDYYDWACVWAGSQPTYTAQSNYDLSVSGKLGGGTAQKWIGTISGDTVTFGYHSDQSGNGTGEGYYATISDTDIDPVANMTSLTMPSLDVTLIDWIDSTTRTIHELALYANVSVTYKRALDITSYKPYTSNYYAIATPGTSSSTLSISGDILTSTTDADIERLTRCGLNPNGTTWPTNDGLPYKLVRVSSIRGLYDALHGQTVTIRTPDGNIRRGVVTAVTTPRNQSMISNITIDITEVE